MRKVKGLKKRTEPRFDTPGSQNSRVPPSIIGVSGGEDAGMGGNNFDTAIRRKHNALVEGVQVSGAAQTPRACRSKIVSLGIEKFKKAGASRQRIGSVSNMPAFAKEAQKGGND